MEKLPNIVRVPVDKEQQLAILESYSDAPDGTAKAALSCGGYLHDSDLVVMPLLQPQELREEYVDYPWSTATDIGKERFFDPCEHCGKTPSNICSGCHLGVYCSAACQKVCWPEHKKICDANTKTTAFTKASRPFMKALKVMVRCPKFRKSILARGAQTIVIETTLCLSDAPASTPLARPADIMTVPFSAARRGPNISANTVVSLAALCLGVNKGGSAIAFKVFRDAQHARFDVVAMACTVVNEENAPLLTFNGSEPKELQIARVLSQAFGPSGKHCVVQMTFTDDRTNECTTARVVVN